MFSWSAPHTWDLQPHLGGALTELDLKLAKCKSDATPTGRLLLLEAAPMTISPVSCNELFSSSVRLTHSMGTPCWSMRSLTPPNRNTLVEDLRKASATALKEMVSSSLCYKLYVYVPLHAIHRAIQARNHLETKVH